MDNNFLYETNGCLYLNDISGEHIDNIQRLFDISTSWLFNKDEMNITYIATEYNDNDITILHKILQKLFYKGLIIYGTINIIYLSPDEFQDTIFVDEYDYLNVHRYTKNDFKTYLYKIYDENVYTYH